MNIKRLLRIVINTFLRSSGLWGKNRDQHSCSVSVVLLKTNDYCKWDSSSPSTLLIVTVVSYPETDLLNFYSVLVTAGIGIYQNRYSKQLPSGALLSMLKEGRKRGGKLIALQEVFQLYRSVREELSKKLSKLTMNLEEEGVLLVACSYSCQFKIVTVKLPSFKRFMSGKLLNIMALSGTISSRDFTKTPSHDFDLQLERRNQNFAALYKFLIVRSTICYSFFYSFIADKVSKFFFSACYIFSSWIC